MPYPVQNLIEGRGVPTTVRPGNSALEALALMVEHDFSQLPVIDESGRPLGMITHGSMLRALSNFGCKLEDLRVSNAIAKAHKYRPEDDLFDALDRLKETNAVLIVDGDERLIGIVTSYDSTEYFRRRAEDMMSVEDIEGMVKDLIEVPFKDVAGEVDAERLAAAVDDVTDRTRDLLGRYKKALRDYLGRRGDEKRQIDPQCLEESFSHLAPPRQARRFDQLTLSEFTELLLHPSQWHLYGPFFNLSREALRKMLDGVRETRNMLVHFRGDISPSQRDQLRFCENWLAQHPAEKLMERAFGIPVSWPVHALPSDQAEVIVAESPGIYDASAQADVSIIPAEEVLGPDDSRYAHLAIHLQTRPADRDRVEFSFEQIEEIIGGDLPASARTHRSWWANDSVGHVQSQQWLDVGWRVAQINVTEERVTFARIKERESDYIRFFSSVLNDVRATTKFPLWELSPDGHSWHTVAKLPEDAPKSLQFAFAFSRGRRFRVELYVETGDRARNKAIFDQLYESRHRIHENIGEELTWERLNEARPCRIAWYRQGSITDDEEILRDVRAWAVNAMVKFYGALAGPSVEALRATETYG